jgi:hypothetical protein
MKTENFRIHQIGDTFYIQQKTIFGWIYVKDKFLSNPPAVLFLAFSIITTIGFMFLKPFLPAIFIVPFVLFAISNVAYFIERKTFHDLELAKSYIQERIDNSKQIKISKYHYLNMQDERKDKLKNLK